MNKLELYSISVAKKTEAFKECLRASGPFIIGPTARGGIFFKFKDKDISTDMSMQELKDMRDLITDFLVNVVGEK